MLGEATLHRSAVAYVYRENPSLARDENLKFYDRVTASGVEVSQFSIQGSELILLRQPKPDLGGLEVHVGGFGPGPNLRLLVNEAVAGRSVGLTQETADLVWDSFQAIWGEKVSQPHLTEVTLELSAPAPQGGSRSFLASSVAHIPLQAAVHLGREFEGFGIQFMSGPVMELDPERPQPVLAGAEVRVRVETLQRDPSRLFMQVTAKWPALNVPVHSLPAAMQRHVKGPVVQANLVGQKPSHYLGLCYDFVTNNLIVFLQQAGH